MNLNTLLLILLFVLMCAVLIWETRLKSIVRARRQARRASIVDAALSEIDARESDLLRERIRGGAEVLAVLDVPVLDNSKFEMTGSKVAV